MAYTKHTWSAGEPITASNMNNIEDGIESVAQIADTNYQTIATVNSQINNEQTGISKKVSTLETVVGPDGSRGLTARVTALESNSSTGSWAAGAIHRATDERLSGETYDTLSDRFDAIDQIIEDQIATATTIDPPSPNGHVNQKTYTDLNQRFNEVENQANAAWTVVDAAKTYTNAAGGVSTFGNLTSRLNWFDRKTDALEAQYNTEANRIDNLQSEIEAAHDSTSFNRTAENENAFTSINARFDATESELVRARGGKANLNARLDDISSELSNAHESTVLNRTGANNYASIDDRFEAIEGQLGDSENGMIRLTTIEDDITSLTSNKVNKSDIVNNLNTQDSVTNHVLDARQGRVLNSAINEVDSAYKAADTILSGRLDTIEEDLNTAEIGLKARIADAETRLTDIDGVNGTVANLSNRMSTAENDIDALENTINTQTTGLVDKVTTLESVSNNIISQITTLSGKDTIVVDYDGIHSNYDNNNEPTYINPTPNADYLIADDNGNYYYWRYINNNWELISGAGGSGTSSAEFYTTFEGITPSETVDYFIGTNNNYIHYRYRNNEWVKILPNHLINNVSVDTSAISAEENAPTKSRPIIKEIGSETNLLADFKAIQSFNAEAVDNGYKLTWVDIDGELRDITITGGSGSSSNINVSISRITDSNITTTSDENCTITYTFSATEPDGSTYETTGQGTWSINGARVATQEVQNGNNTFNIKPYLHNGINNITLSVTINADGQNITRTKTWVVNVINFSLTWEYEESTINRGSVINFSCIPYGTDLTKTLYLKIGQYEQSQTVTTSGIPVTVTLNNNFSHGSHTAEMWMSATINGVSKTSAHISHDFIVVESGNTTPIIAASLPSSEINQYDTISIPFVVYTPTSSLSTVILSVDGITQDTRTDIGRSTQTWNYTPSTSGSKTLTITSGSITKTLMLTVNSININNNEIGGYAFKLKASELSSNSALQSWKYGANDNTKLQFSNNFDWINGGIQTERDSNNQIRQYIRIKPGTTMTIPYKMFYGTDPRINGSNFKIIFKVENCRNYDAVVATSVADNIGIQLNAHNAIFKSTTTQVSTQYGENEYTELEFEVYKNHLANGTEAPNPYMIAWIDGVMTSARPYDGNFVQSENNAKDIVIGSNDCDICIYLVKYYPTVLTISEHISNFIADAPNAAEMIRRYNRNDILDEDNDISYSKLADKNKDCRVWLYDIPRMTTAKDDYVGGVSFQQIYKNGTAYQDGLHGVGTLSVQGTSSVNYRKGAANTDINFYDTKDEGRKALCELYDGENNNLLFNNINGENVLKPETERGYKINTNSAPITYSNMKVNFASCEQVNNMCNAEWYQQFQPYPSLSTRDCMEFVMGVQFIHDQGLNEPSGEVILFNEKTNRKSNKYYMYSIGNLGTSKKNTHIFHSNNECCIEVNNNENAGCRMISVPTDLAADYTAYLNEDYEGMSNYDWSGKTDGKDHSYGMRYPDVKNPDKEIKAGWARFVKWMAENNPGAATNNALTEAETYAPYTFRGHVREGTQVLRGTTVNQYAGTYTTDSFERRMAKMLSECEDYIAMDSVVYHFLFIERHTMVDNVSKNTFWSAAKTNQYINGVEQDDTEGYWIWDLSKNYDNDTSDGNNNEGQLIFDYGNEASDRQDGKAVFNASDAVWFVFISNLYEACQTMFQNREAATSKNGQWQNAWNATAYHNYLLSEQQKIPECVWNECYWYDYLRTYETGKVKEDSDSGQIIDKSWITFLDGGQKTHQRWHYETFEELYDASKYRSAFSTANSITLRGYTPDDGDPSLLAVPAKSEIAIKMYNKCYLTAHFGNNIQTQKVAKGVLTTLQFLEDGQYMKLSDTVINIDTASMIQEIGDLAPLYPGQASFSAAIRLRSIKIGDSTTGYNNPHITNTETGTVDFGANYMLEHLEVQNLSNANQPLNLSGCPALSYLDARGSSFTSIVFANGGLLSEAYINNPSSLTMRNLDLLTTSNFHITDPTSITQLRLEGCNLFTNKLSFVESLTNLNVIRLTGINWILNTTTILDTLLNIMGMDELGYTTTQSYLAGNISLTGTVYGGDYNRYLAAWSPDLTIDVSQASSFITQHLVTYHDEDGTVLYSKYINHNDDFIDIVSTQEREAPTKQEDNRSRYTFGRVQYSQYLAYSGWRLEAATQSMYPAGASSPTVPPVNGDMDVYAVYSETPQQYIVRWLVGSTVVKTTDAQNYGSGYSLSAPTIKEAQTAGATTSTFTDNRDGTCSYKIMTGWEKLPTNINPPTKVTSYDINATWLQRTNVEYNDILTSDEYTIAEKLLVLKNIETARNTLEIQDIFPVTLGYDGIKPAINLLASPKRYTGTADAPITAYTPFAENTSFTIAIDYRFEHVTSTSANEAVLLSCYDDSGDSVQGFKLFYNPRTTNTNPVPQISFGSTNTISDANVYTLNNSINNRGIVVLRHRAGEPTLYVYSGSSSNGLNANYSATDFRKTLTGSGITSNAKIILGGVSSSSVSSINAQGTIYSIKYWEEDLGEGECVQLANWCHETMNFAVQDIASEEVHSAIRDGSSIKLVLHTLNASQMGIITDPRIDSSTETAIGWDPTTIRTLYNERVYTAFPIMLQSIMTPVSTIHVKANKESNGYFISRNSSETFDYVFAPSCIETGLNITATVNNQTYNPYAPEAAGPFLWSGLSIRQYSNGAFSAPNNTSSAYINLRFPYSAINISNTTTVYVGYPAANKSFEQYASEESLPLKAGDILIPDDNSGAYIYINSTDVPKGAPYILYNSDKPLCLAPGGNGAWIASTSWWTRSTSTETVNNYLTAMTKARLTSINSSGTPQAHTYKSNGIVYSIAF